MLGGTGSPFQATLVWACCAPRLCIPLPGHLIYPKARLISFFLGGPHTSVTKTSQTYLTRAISFGKLAPQLFRWVNKA